MMKNIVLYCILLIVSLITFVLVGIDKRRAVKHRWRIPEATLLIFSLFGGNGGFLGMLCFRHKTRKWKFRILMPVFALIQLVTFAFLGVEGGNHAQFGDYGITI